MGMGMGLSLHYLGWLAYVFSRTIECFADRLRLLDWIRGLMFLSWIFPSFHEQHSSHCNINERTRARIHFGNKNELGRMQASHRFSFSFVSYNCDRHGVIPV